MVRGRHLESRCLLEMSLDRKNEDAVEGKSNENILSCYRTRLRLIDKMWIVLACLASLGKYFGTTSITEYFMLRD